MTSARALSRAAPTSSAWIVIVPVLTIRAVSRGAPLSLPGFVEPSPVCRPPLDDSSVPAAGAAVAAGGAAAPAAGTRLPVFDRMDAPDEQAANDRAATMASVPTRMGRRPFAGRSDGDEGMSRILRRTGNEAGRGRETPESGAWFPGRKMPVLRVHASGRNAGPRYSLLSTRAPMLR